MFFEQNKDALQTFSRISKTIGARADYVQGGGGNTSVKLEGGLMAIKASGFCLRDIEADKAYAVLDCAAIRSFYLSSEPEQFADVEAAGSAKAKESIRPVEGLASLRPSVEAGFHSLLGTYVIHTHSVYANLACCAVTCREIAAQALSGADYTWGWVKYTDPGARLTFAIRDELRRAEQETGRTPSVILLQNHGFIVHDDDPDRALEIHQDANERLARAFGLTGESFPGVEIRRVEDGLYEAATPYLTEALRSGAFTEQFLLEQPLFPDQIVFLNGNISVGAGAPAEGTCSVDPETGRARMRMDEGRARVMAETLTAVVFVVQNVRAAGYALSTMGDAAKSFIANWESEKYRKSLAGKKG